MRCYPDVDFQLDEAKWVPVSVFQDHFDQEDFVIREVRNVRATYQKDWFRERDDRLFFILPTVQFVDGHTQFVNGRHRVAVLLDHMDTLPLAFARKPWDPDAKPRWFNGLTTLAPSKSFDLPDLPIEET